MAKFPLNFSLILNFRMIIRSLMFYLIDLKLCSGGFSYEFQLVEIKEWIHLEGTVSIISRSSGVFFNGAHEL